jgi:hypothetical protein
MRCAFGVQPGWALDAPARGHSLLRASAPEALVYSCQHLNFDLWETTCAVPRLGNGSARWFDPFGQFIEQIQSRNRYRLSLKWRLLTA